MSERPTLAQALERIRKRLIASPERGRRTAVSRTRMRQGLTCEVEEGPWRLVCDMDPKVGGAGAGPSPGVYGRAALGSCLSITYAMWAARLGVPISEIEVEVQADFDSGGFYGTSSSPAGYSEVRCLVRVVSPAPAEEVLRVLDEADAHSPYYDVFTRGQKLVRSARVLPGDLP